MATFHEVKERVLQKRRLGIVPTLEECQFLNQVNQKRIKDVCDYFCNSLPDEMKITPSDDTREIELKLSFGEKLIKLLADTFNYTMKVVTETFDKCVSKIKEFFSDLLSF